MKKLLIAVFVVSITLFVTACTTTENNDADINDFVDSIMDSQLDTENSATEDSKIDYTAYANLVNTYFDLYGELVVEQNYADGGLNTAGFNYTNLIDLDNDGVLELILAGVSDDMDTIKNGESAIDLYYNASGNLNELVKIYTLSNNGEALLLKEQAFSSYGNGGVEFGIEYAKEIEKTYILNSFRSNNEAVTYYEFSDGELKENWSYELNYDYDSGEYSAILNGQESDTKTIEDELATKGEIVMHRISWLSEEELDELVARNERTFLFLEQFSTINRPSTQSENNAVDYSPYSALLKAYELDYNIVNVAADDYEVVGMTVNEIEDSGFYDASGFFYADLIDFDGNGVLELVLAATSEQEVNNYENGFSYDDLKYPNIVKIYTIANNGNLTFLESLPVKMVQMPVSLNYAIRYANLNDKTYMVIDERSQMGFGEIQYYSLTDGFFGVEVFCELTDDGVYKIDGEEVSEDEYNKLSDNLEDNVSYPVSNLTDIYLEDLREVSQKTIDFLADYPIRDFISDTGAYNDGKFYYVEYSSQATDLSNSTIYNYFKALTMNDFDALRNLYADSQHSDIEYRINSYDVENGRIFIPGYIIWDIQTITPSEIEHPDLAKDLTNMLNSVPENKNSLLIKVVINEVLDPHVSQLGMQVAGGVVDMYFIMSNDAQNGSDWKIENTLDNKFYW